MWMQQATAKHHQGHRGTSLFTQGGITRAWQCNLRSAAALSCIFPGLPKHRVTAFGPIHEPQT